MIIVTRNLSYIDDLAKIIKKKRKQYNNEIKLSFFYTLCK